MLAPPRPGRQRLTSINNPYAGGPRGSLPSPPSTAPAKPAKKQCCDDPSPEENDDGRMMCVNCAKVLSTATYSTELTFGENAAGGATVVGGFISDSQRHANTMGGTMRGLGSNMESRQKTVQNGEMEIRKIAAELNLPERIVEHANNWYKLALNHNFVQGRRISHVAAVAIYLTARKQPENTLLLIDLSERVEANVWELGRTYKEFCKTIMETDPAHLAGNRTVQEIEPLMLKFCRKLEFGEYSMRVADDACKLLKSMKRDWMVQGRNPAGLCGACIIMAARMNNFRRTVREVVYVVKVADTTINQRLYEYKRTASSTLTVNQFRKFGDKMKPLEQPPAVWKREEKERRAEKRKMALLGANDDDHSEFDGDDRGTPQSNSRKPATRATKKQRTNNGKARATYQNDDPSSSTIDIEALEAGDLDALASVTAVGEAGDGSAAPSPKKRGRRKKAPPMIIPDEDLEIEQNLEEEIEGTIEDWQTTFKEFEENEHHPALVRASERAREIAAQHMPGEGASLDKDIESEFEDDPDVANCLLSDREIYNKERIWNAQNEDWLREQQQKILQKEYEEACGKTEKPKKKRQKSTMGDGSVLGGKPAESPAEGAMAMVNKHAKAFSSHLDYERIKGLFPDEMVPSQVPTPEDSASAGATPPTQEPVQESTHTPVQVVEDEELDDEEEEEEDDDEPEPTFLEEEDLENEHNYEDDEGFGDESYGDY